MSNARFIVILLLALTFIAFAAQFAIDFSAENIATACIVLASSLAILLYIHWTGAIQTHPLSTFAIFGFCMSTQLGALLVQSATWTALSLNLRQPIETFATLAGFQAIALVAHGVYRLFSNAASPKKLSLVRAVLEKLGLYATPTVGTLWIMGVIGLFSLLVGGGEGAVRKTFQAMSFVAWAPFLIPIYLLQQGSSYCNAKKNYLFLMIYMSLIVLLGMAANARALMLAGAMTIAIFALLSVMRSTRPVKVSQLAKTGVLLVVMGAIAIPVTDLVTAMVLARKARGYVSPVQMVDLTLYYFQRPQLLHAQREKDSFISIRRNYDETYFASPLIARLVETKFHDNALYFGSRVGPKGEEKLRDITGDFFWATLPDPALKSLEIDVDKKDLAFSMGDYISHLGGGGGLGGFKTGSAFAHGIILFGYFFPLIYLLICPILFLAHDLLSYRSANGRVILSALGMLGIWKLFQYGISAESLQAMFMGVVRGVPQNIILYLVIFHMARLGARMLGSLAGMSRPSA
ncbi:MAG: hypothetical protein K0M48_03445 [Thiobacillus sp.]|nr:hypothetical protein [Thiobacillus sp.]